MFNTNDFTHMQRAIELAKIAAHSQEVPVGAVLVLDDKIIAEGFNSPLQTNDPTAHAEIITIRRAAEKLKNYRLVHSTLYVTLEPCLMCIGAMVHARIQRVIFGAADAKIGAVESAKHIAGFNHCIDYAGGLLAEECGRLLQEFFRARR